MRPSNRRPDRADGLPTGPDGDAQAHAHRLRILRLPFSLWKSLALASWREQSEDNIGLIAAGVAFYGFLALVPLLGAVVLIYGLVASPGTVVENVRHLAGVMPPSAAKLIGEQLMHLVQTSGGKKGAGLALALAIALFGARNGAGALITALNIAYEEKETRSFVDVNLLALGMTMASVVSAIVATVSIAVIGHLEDLAPVASGVLSLVSKVLTYLLLAAAGAAGAATLYRFGPARHEARWEWLTPGSAFATAGWLLLTLGFGLYVSRIGHYDVTYGSLGAVIVLLTWLYLSSYVFLFGAELNAELEKRLRHAEPSPAAAEGDKDAVLAPIPPQAAPTRPSASGSTPPSLPIDLLAAETIARAMPLLDGRKVGTLTAALGVVGLGYLRQPRRARQGIVLLGAAAAISIVRGRWSAQGSLNGR